MSYCIVSSGNDCDRFVHFYSGELSVLARCVLDESEEVLNACRDGMTLAECEDWYCCDFESYRKLKRIKKNFKKEHLESYYFQMDDMWVSASVACEKDELEEMIYDFISDKELDYSLKPELTDTQLHEAFYELESIYDKNCENPKYFIFDSDDDDEDDIEDEE